MTHYDDPAWWVFLQGNENEAMATHLAGCDDCGDRVTRLQRLDQVFRQNRFWEVYQSGNGVPDDTPAVAIGSLASRLREEERDARLEVDRIATDPESALAVPLTAGLLVALFETIRRYIDLDPRVVLRLSNVAVTLSDRLPPDYPEQLRLNLRVQARKERANGLRLVGRFPEALALLERTETMTEDLVVNEPALAMLSYVRATVLRDMGRFDDAHRDARWAATLFERFGDSERALHARLLVAAILFRRGMVAAAREEWTSLLLVARDDVTRARLIHNIACALHEERDFDAALIRSHEARDAFEALGMRTEMARVEWNIGLIHLAKNALAAALAQFHLARRVFLACAMQDEASLVALDIAETWVLLGRHDDAADILSPLVGWFTAAGSDGRAQQTLGLLREALGERRFTTEQITVLRAAMRNLQDARGTIVLQPCP